MSQTDDLLANNERHASSFDQRHLPGPPARKVDDDFKASIETETGIKPGWAAEAFTDLDQDVRQSIARIEASPFIPRKDSIRGFVYEVHTGRLREVT